MMKSVDIAHPPMRGEEAESVLDDLLRTVRNAGVPTAVKIIHGHGGNALLKQTVQNWIYRNRTRLRVAIPGERYEITDAETAAMRLSCGQVEDADLGAANPGITLLWIDIS
jgi:creatinine amidohydrolase/Fe(II)-dependent formamide hydrolase-like protein